METDKLAQQTDKSALMIEKFYGSFDATIAAMYLAYT
jgi:hypothetical protein